MKFARTIAALVLAATGMQARASAIPARTAADAQALDLAEKAIALRSVVGPGNETPRVAALFRDALVEGGFAADQISITPVDDTAYLIARWPGFDPSLAPVVISGHMDVVEARRADWQRNPFAPIVENGYLFGRGATDMKLDASVALASLIELKREGYRPRRTIVIEFSGDEETSMKTSALITQNLSNAELVINIDGGGGKLDERTGRPQYFLWQGAEKTYADFEMRVTSEGVHFSAPRKREAIEELAEAVVAVGRHRFKPETNALTRAYFVSAAKYADPTMAAAMRAFARNASDRQAIATLSTDPFMVGKIGTTCVTTLIGGGHARNALPQSASANINCRIFPGHEPAEIMSELAIAAGNSDVHFRDVTVGSVPNDASPMRADFNAAVERAMSIAYPGVPVIPSMASGASDSMWFRARNVASYSASPIFLKDSEDFSHGLNERTPIAGIDPGITYYLSLLPSLAG